MARNRFAQPLYGKIIYIYETDLEKDQLSTVFDPSTYWIDITGMDCEVGYILEYVEGGGLRFVPPPNYAPLTFEEMKSNKVAALKAERDNREVAIIEYRDITLDYDDKARERLALARQSLEDNDLPYITWTCADNTRAVLTVEDFKNINTIAAARSNALHEQYNLLKDYIDVIETEEELVAIDFDTVVPDLSEFEEDIVEETLTDDDLLVDEVEESTEELVENEEVIEESNSEIVE
jgi:hypothetical protein